MWATYCKHWSGNNYRYVDEKIDNRRNKWSKESINELVNKWINTLINQWSNDKWINERMNEWMNKYIDWNDW